VTAGRRRRQPVVSVVIILSALKSYRLVMNTTLHRSVTYGHPTRLLLVDSNPYALIGLRTLLQDAADVEVVAEATTRADALRLIPKVEPDVVITDRGTQRMDGCGLAAAIKAACPQQPVVMLSLADGPAERRSAREAGVDVFMSKDATRVQIVRQIRRLRLRRVV
jgi:two-component system nitrate/nitrite response regulator NarL